jgi:chorismate mutase
MADIVKRLRENWTHVAVAYEAADEIDELRDELQRARKGGDILDAEIMRLIAERDRLQKELDQALHNHGDVVRRKKRAQKEIDRLRGAMLEAISVMGVTGASAILKAALEDQGVPRDEAE